MNLYNRKITTVSNIVRKKITLHENIRMDTNIIRKKKHLDSRTSSTQSWDLKHMKKPSYKRKYLRNHIKRPSEFENSVIPQELN